MQRSKKTMEKIVALAKNRGFVFPGSEIYGGLANTWDYGPAWMYAVPMEPRRPWPCSTMQ